MTSSTPNFLKALILASEKAANVARVCRSEKHLFSLLIEEKKATEANPRFVQDFKTLADVLIQETVRHDLATEFPHMHNRIFGEESNTFVNTMSKTINVNVQENAKSTADLLELVLDGDSRAAHLLAEEVHSQVDFEKLNTDNKTAVENAFIDTSNIGVWIDPIDSTAEYIHGNESKEACDTFHKNGLQCVTVLIGAFDLDSGRPIAGVVNQPFHHQENKTWIGKCYWGVCTADLQISSFPLESPTVNESHFIAISGFENEDVRQKLREIGFVPAEITGAGYKALSVCQRLTDLYLVSRGSLYNWDSCAPHAILRAMGGGIIEFQPAKDQGKMVEVVYNNWNKEEVHDKDTGAKNIDVWRHKNGIIAYRNGAVLQKIIDTFNEK